MLTGQEIDKTFDWKVGVPYTGYLDSTKKNRLFRNTLFHCAEKKWFGLKSQKEYDEMSAMIATEKAFSLTGNRIPLYPIMVSALSAAGVTATATTLYPHCLAVGDIVRFQNIAGFTSLPAINANSFTVTAISSSTVFQFTIISSSGAYTPNSGSLTHLKMVIDYMHLFSVRCGFNTQIQVVMSKIFRSTPARIQFKKPSSLRSGEQIVISGAPPITGVNGTVYVGAVDNVTYELFSDAALSVPVVGAANTSIPLTATISRISSRYAVPVNSDRKIDALNQFTERRPGYETAERALKIYPLTKTCTGIIMDYMTVPPVFIDVDDNIIDMELIFPPVFLYHIIATAGELYAGPTRDMFLNKDAQEEIIQNP